jgi:bifunctional non-homologous end joining protein LigD
MLLRFRRTPPGFIEPCLPLPERPRLDSRDQARRLPAHGRRDAAGVRLATRKWPRLDLPLPLIREAVEARRVRSCLLDGEAIAFEDDGVASFELLGHRRHDRLVTLCALDLIEIDGKDLRREPSETRKATSASLLHGSLPGLGRRRRIGGRIGDS